MVSAIDIEESAILKIGQNPTSIKFNEFGWFESYTTALNNIGLINYNLGKYYDSIDGWDKSTFGTKDGLSPEVYGTLLISYGAREV